MQLHPISDGNGECGVCMGYEVGAGKSLLPMLQLIHVSLCMGGSKGKVGIHI